MSEAGFKVVVVMGVSGCGKTTVGRGLAQRLGWRFLEGDAFHPPANVEKMARGCPLNDDDRWPWLERLQGAIVKARQQCDRNGDGVVVACSALKQAYRDILGVGSDDIIWVYLQGTFEQLQQRLQRRAGHFMPAELLASQFADLEEPQGAIVLDSGRSPSELITTLIEQK